MSDEKEKDENLRLVYAEVNNNRRHYSNLRFAVLSVYFAILASVASVGFGIVELKPNAPAGIILGARVAGWIFTLVFFSFEILCEMNLHHLKKVAIEVEGSFEYKQFGRRRFYGMPRAIYFTSGMYIALIIFWTITIFHWLIYRR